MKEGVREEEEEAEMRKQKTEKIFRKSKRYMEKRTMELIGIKEIMVLRFGPSKKSCLNNKSNSKAKAKISLLLVLTFMERKHARKTIL